MTQSAGLATVISGSPPLASHKTFGSGCAGPNTKPPSLRATSRPIIGGVFALKLENLKPFSGGLLVLGVSNKRWGTTPLPLKLGFMRMPSCQLLVSWDLALPVFTQTKSITGLLTIPPDNGLLGFEFFTQLWILDSTANPAGIATSNGGKGVIGY